ncbi:hypothetical protein K435DRAFT_973941 [Dendrothele bispora CBS 962.96]|uniref:Uncharacterized protein n=1 Tax=Dendrothele bispora (strain CBS 962.96) TaxID=1314807 RepID=A0A4S8KPJ0_DENBC|nr:hypothetical protein K435DRAFT_973941 [Dendrothele bispora CBS 962.96]
MPVIPHRFTHVLHLDGRHSTHERSKSKTLNKATLIATTFDQEKMDAVFVPGDRNAGEGVLCKHP